MIKATKLTSIIATVVTILSFSIVPAAYAGTTIGLSFDLDAECVFANSTAGSLVLSAAGVGGSSTGSFTMSNTGTALQNVAVDLGDHNADATSTGVGGFRDTGDNVLHVLNTDVTVDATDTASDIVAATQFAADATPTPIATLEPANTGNEGANRNVDLTVDLTNLQNPLGAAGQQDATMTFTLGCSDPQPEVQQ